MSGFIQSGRFGAAAFSPLSIAWDHAYWAEGTEFVALGLSDGGAITTVPDEIGTGDMTQTTAGAKPTYRSSHAALNSLPAWDADGGDWMRTDTLTTINQPFTVVGVFEGISSGGIAVEMTETGGSTQWALYNNGSWMAYSGSVISGGTADTSKHLFVYVADGASSKIIVDGSTLVTGNAGAEELVKLGMFAIAGGSYPVSGAGAFLAVATGVLGSTDLSDLLTWSQGHYGTP